MPDHEAETVVPDSRSADVASERTVGAGPTPRMDGAPLLPATIGRYRIISLLGEGGMGAVYEAEQEHPQRTVALKVIRAGYANAEMLRRFENETQALGRLQHPGIAQIYDAGTAETPFGYQPYFAMELVHGQTLLTYCETHQLNPRQRLELVAKICDAVQHAHQRGLIHRDLKPANILVDEAGQPRILDFGVARLTDSDAHATRQTDIGQLVGTLAYMSPEQVLGDPAEIDTRSDVYALGIILYELLAGKLPYTIGRQLHDAVRVIREEEPERLSSVHRTYRGDVETIVARALEKDKSRRYASAAELAADIRRYLHDEPIVARPPSTTYQLQKFARRNRALVVGVAAVLVVLVLGIAASTWEAVQARRAQKQAQQQAAISQAVNDFLQKDLLGQASAFSQEKPDPNITVRTVLDRAAKNIQGKFNQQPEVEAAIRDTIGNAYYDLGLSAEAQKQLQPALALGRRVLGPENPKMLAILFDVARVDTEQGKYGEAEKLLSEAIGSARRVLGQQHPETLQAMGLLGKTYSDEGKNQEAETLLQQTVDLDRRVLGPAAQSTAITMGYLVGVYTDEGKYTQAESLAGQLLQIDRQRSRANDPFTLSHMNELAAIYLQEGKYSQAEAMLRETLEMQRRLFGPEHPNTLTLESNLAACYLAEGKYAQAETLVKPALGIERRLKGRGHRDTAILTHILLKTYAAEGKYAEAEELCREAIPDFQDNSVGLMSLAWFRLTAADPRLRRPEEALGEARRGVKLTPGNGNYLNTLGLAEVRNSLWKEAIPTLQKAIALHGATDPSDFFVLALAYEQKGDTAQAEQNLARGTNLASKGEMSDDTKMLQADAAKALGKPRPHS
jgi:eukaryotic-like serine/threonine-protein kinase